MVKYFNIKMKNFIDLLKTHSSKLVEHNILNNLDYYIFSRLLHTLVGARTTRYVCLRLAVFAILQMLQIIELISLLITIECNVVSQ